MGFAVLLVLLFYLSHLALASIHERLPMLLAVPLLAMLSLSFAYGRVLTMQNTFASSALFSLGHDIASNRQLREAKRIYMAVSDSDHWLVAASGSFKQMPVLRYLLNIDFFFMLAEKPAQGGHHQCGRGEGAAQRDPRRLPRLSTAGGEPVLPPLSAGRLRFYRHERTDPDHHAAVVSLVITSSIPHESFSIPDGRQGRSSGGDRPRVVRKVSLHHCAGHLVRRGLQPAAG